MTDQRNIDSLNRTNPTFLADQLRMLKIGNILAGQVVQHARKVNMDSLGSSPYNVATLDAMHLPAESRALFITRAYARAGGITAGPLTVVARGVTPATGEIGVAPNGDIVTLAADALTDIDVTYIPDGGEVFEAVLPVVSDAIALPANVTSRGVVLLVEAEALEGTLTGKKIVLVESASAAATTQARLDLARANVKFASADAVTRARVKLVLAPASADQLQNALAAAAETY